MNAPIETYFIALGHGMGYLMYHRHEPILYSRRKIIKLNDIPNQCFFNSGSAEINRTRGSIPAKVGFWVGVRFFSYVPTPTKLTNAISKNATFGSKKGGVLAKNTSIVPLFYFWREHLLFWTRKLHFLKSR